MTKLISERRAKFDPPRAPLPFFKMADKPVQRLNYIGSKFTLLEWLETEILKVTGWPSLDGKRIGDLFAGTGIVSHYLRSKGAVVLTNDAELYSSFISAAMAASTHNARCIAFLAALNAEIADARHATTFGFITRNYSPHDTCERMFFTCDNAQRIDYCRGRIEAERDSLTAEEYNFMVASLLVSADAVSNVPAVYGCYLKAFKKKAQVILTMRPIHRLTTAPAADTSTYHSDVLAADWAVGLPATDLVYLDPPYNERQYSKNYFPLNMIALTPTDVEREGLHGKTGIPDICFMSPFCKKTEVASAFKKLVGGLRAEWVCISYNSESLICRTDMEALLRAFGDVTVVERSYKRFKAYEYNEDKEIQEFLYCLHKRGGAGAGAGAGAAV